MRKLPCIKYRLMKMLFFFHFERLFHLYQRNTVTLPNAKGIILCPAVAWRDPQSMKETLVKYKQALS